MQEIICPHCGHQGTVGAKVPKEVVVVLPCPACHDLVVLFRRKVIGLKREILEHGTFEERKAHIAGVIAQFLDPEVLPELMGMWQDEDLGDDDPDVEDAPADGDFDEPEPSAASSSLPGGITPEEFERFVHFDLKMLDDRNYFRRHFSK